MALAKGCAEGICEARGCSNPATLRIQWSNPQIPWAASKTWLSCAQHEGFLADYMRYRGFPFEVTPYILSTEDEDEDGGA